MEKQEGVTINFTIKGADPNATMDPNTLCAICDKTLQEHTEKMHWECADKTA